MKSSYEDVPENLDWPAFITGWKNLIQLSESVVCFCKVNSFENRIAQTRETLHFTVLMCCGGVARSKMQNLKMYEVAFSFDTVMFNELHSNMRRW